jgi:membrane-associated PAP2 superfamily phosphatase
MTAESSPTPVNKAFPAVQREFPALWFFLIWLAVAVAATVPFWLGDLDMRWARALFMEGGFPRENDALWRFFYHAAPVLVGVLALAGLVMSFAGVFNPRLLYLRPMGLYLILTVGLGPGLFVNALGKEYAGRPRPRQVLEPGSQLTYLAPFQFGKPGQGKSFPCGHCSVGFSFAALWLLLRRRNLWLGRAALVGGLTLGMVMGVGRMAAGAHFFSDVLWASLLTMLAAALSYYYILRMPARWAAWAEGQLGAGGRAASSSLSRAQKAWAALVFGGVGAVLVFFLLLASPVHEDPSYVRENAGEDPAVVILEVANARTSIIVRDGDIPAVAANAKVRGFGLPSNKVRLRGSLEKVDKVPTVTVQFTRKGLYTDYEAGLEIVVNRRKVRRVEIRQEEGTLLVVDPGEVEVDTSKVPPKVLNSAP